MAKNVEEAERLIKDYLEVNIQAEKMIIISKKSNPKI
jgi:hypothetical protein